ncbi:hypothetical protein AMK16_21550 [Streptomyces sp. CB00455]|nr:hypothetical protein AMK16_21550 [Streptomyces sp. CB00455]
MHLPQACFAGEPAAPRTRRPRTCRRRATSSGAGARARKSAVPRARGTAWRKDGARRGRDRRASATLGVAVRRGGP